MHILFLCFAFILTPFIASAEQRLGLVIGNDNYAQVENLQKARADASAVSEALQARGYTVATVLDAPRRQMNLQISQFISRLDPGDTALVFYAGHGVEIDGENYLLPTDIATPARGEEDFVKSESIALSGLLDRIRATGATTTLAIIDACRDNPFKASNNRSIGRTRGLGRIIAPQGTFVVFSAGAGQTALDRLDNADPSDNSVFTRMLLPRLKTPGLELRDMVSGLRRDVRDLARTVGHEQFPAYYDELLGQFYFTPDTPADPPVAVTEEPQPEAFDAIRADFDLARSLNTHDAYSTFIEQYAERQDEFTVRMAMKLRDDLGGAEAEEPAPAAQETPDNVPDTPAPIMSRRDILRETQAHLNALGCNAGVADGIVGPRSRAAFRRFLAATDTDLQSGDLGTARALELIKSRSGTLCKQVAASPSPGASVTATPTAPVASAPKPRTYSLAGSWRWSATCPLGVTASGSTVYRSTGGNSYSGTINSTVGRGTLRGTLNGRSYSATENFGWITNTANGTMSRDGGSMSIRVSNGCRVTARKG